MMLLHRSPRVVSAALLIASPTLAGGLGTNLVVNGGAEMGGTIGWISAGVDPVAIAVAGLVGVPPGETLGRFCFSGGLGAPIETITQTIDLSAFALLIDTGQVEASFHVLVQSRAIVGASDTVTGTLTYLNAAAEPVAVIGIADSHIAIGVNDWNAVDDARVLAAGVRSATLTFTFDRDVGVSIDAYCDNSTLILANACPTDLNGDGVTDAMDLAILLGAWGTSGVAADIDGNGSVNAADLAVLLGGWGPCS